MDVKVCFSFLRVCFGDKFFFFIFLTSNLIMKTIYGFSMSASSSEIRDVLKDGELQKLISSIISSSNAENVSTVFSNLSFSHKGSFIVLNMSGYNNIHAKSLL